MKAIILAAGYATRLYPITLKQPKALLPINDKPIISYIVEELNEIPEISTIYVITNDLFKDFFYEWKKEVNSSIQIEIVNDHTISEETKLGAIGDLQYCINEKNIDEDTLVIAGDSFFNFKLKDFAQNFRDRHKDTVCVEEIKDIESLKRFAVANLGEENKIIQIEEKPQEPKSNNAVYAIYLYTKESIEMVKKYLEDGEKPDAPGYFLVWLQKQKDVLAYKIQGNCYDIGTLKSYEQVQEIVKKRM